VADLMRAEAKKTPYTKDYDMNLIERAYFLGDEQKLRAKQIYKKALHRTAQSFGKWSTNNAHTQLSVEFGELWVLYVEGGKFDSEAVRRANNAFNYANLELGSHGKILTTAKEVLSEADFAAARFLWLKRSACEFDVILTNA
jgi:hypothetical protein